MWFANEFCFAIFSATLLLYQRLELNPGPRAPKSDALTTRLCGRQGQEFLHWLFVTLLCMLIKKWPLRMPMASEVTFDLWNEVRDLGYLCSSAYFISLSLKRLFSPGGGGGRKQRWHVEPRTSPQVKIYVGTKLIGICYCATFLISNENSPATQYHRSGVSNSGDAALLMSSPAWE